MPQFPFVLVAGINHYSVIPLHQCPPLSWGEMLPCYFRRGKIILSQVHGHDLLSQLNTELGESMVLGRIYLELDSLCPLISLKNTHVFISHPLGTRNRAV